MEASRAPHTFLGRAVRVNRIVGLALGILVSIAVACASPAETPDLPVTQAPREGDATGPLAVATPSSATVERALPESSVEDVTSETTSAALQNPIAEVVRELNPRGPKQFVDDVLYQLLDRDDIYPVYEPAVATAEDAELGSNDLVIGLSISGESRAYPIRALRFREMVNDELGGVPILVTW